MSVFFNAREIFEMAIEIERNGKRFYLEAAASAGEESARREFEELSAMEEQHESVFSDLLRDVALDALGAQWYDPAGEAALYLQQFADGEVFDLTRGAPPGLTGPGADLRAVIEYAIDREGDSVLFYTGLKEIMPSAGEREKVDRIIREEMGHIALLGQRLSKQRSNN